MSAQPETTVPEEEKSQDYTSRGIDFCYDTMEGILNNASVNGAYGEAIRTEFDQVIIPSAETINYAGYFIGTGSGPTNTGQGVGGAGGARILSRPVAVIVADKNGVEVKPVLDTSKISDHHPEHPGFHHRKLVGHGPGQKIHQTA